MRTLQHFTNTFFNLQTYLPTVLLIIKLVQMLWVGQWPGIQNIGNVWFGKASTINSLINDKLYSNMINPFFEIKRNRFFTAKLTLHM